jgi:hypothetical protein
MKIFFHKCKIPYYHTGYKDCPCENIVIDWDYIKRLIKYPELITLLANNLHETVKNTYSLEAVTRNRAEIYKNLIKNK